MQCCAEPRCATKGFQCALNCSFPQDQGESTTDAQKDYPPPPCVARFEAGGFLYLAQDAVPEFLAQDE